MDIKNGVHKKHLYNVSGMHGSVMLPVGLRHQLPANMMIFSILFRLFAQDEHRQPHLFTIATVEKRLRFLKFSFVFRMEHLA